MTHQYKSILTRVRQFDLLSPTRVVNLVNNTIQTAQAGCRSDATRHSERPHARPHQTLRRVQHNFFYEWLSKKDPLCYKNIHN